MAYRDYIAVRVAGLIRERDQANDMPKKRGVKMMECPSCHTQGEVLKEKRGTYKGPDGKGKSYSGAVLERCKTCGGKGWLPA